MNANYSAFLDRPEARQLRDALMNPAMIAGYEDASRSGDPAIQAALAEIEPILERFDPATRKYAIQASGAFIGDLLASRGYRKKRRGSVRKSRFVRSGTVWEPLSDVQQEHRRKVEVIMDDIIVRYRTTLTELAK